MKKTNFFKKVYNNLYNIKEFPKYMREGLGRAILYAVMLSLILGLVQGIGVTLNLKKGIDATIQDLSSEKYEFQLKDGILTMKNSPIKVEESGILLYIDSDKELSNKEELRSISVHSDMSILILKDGIIYTDLGSEYEVSFKDLFIGTIDNDDIISQIKLIAKVMPPIFLVITVVAYFVDYLMNCLLVAIFAMISNMILGLRIRFSGIYSLAIYAATLPNILITGIAIFIPTLYLTPAMTIGTLLYVILILRNIRREALENNNIN
ncbi:MAG: DUF1189 domain-containing protein [Clostridium sp.]